MIELDRFYEKVFFDTNGRGCWLWTANCMRKGYGKFRVGSRKDGSYKQVLAHRFSWKLHKGPVPDDKFVCHTCDVRNCVNPNHLFLGTNRDNMRDMALKGRAARGPRHLRTRKIPC